MIVVDTSVWIDHFDDARTPQVARLRAIIDGDEDLIVVGDLVLTELLQGVASSREARRLMAEFQPFVIRDMVGEHVAVQAAAHYRTLRALGITVRKTIDMLIGTFCIENALPLLHADRDFGHMERPLGLLSVPVRQE